ncbi:hypothetical protein D6D01_08553 [Aureobasidium pullulans]|uniref:Uncharacterized protein n=1 Tax=Aureobasidium pullulans TaxID=5580 RepID=A0A4S9KCG5_AURPU|nr:hypothetical protein D6D01_08553 [Aureobasidium pullulans]
MLSSFEEFSYAAPKFEYFIAPPEDPYRPSLPAELRERIFSMVLAAKVRGDLGIRSSKVVLLASRGCAEYQENPRPVNFKKEQLNIMLVSKAISAEAKKTLLDGLVIKFTKHEDFVVFMTQKVKMFGLPSAIRFTEFSRHIRNFEFAFVIPGWYEGAHGCLKALMLLIELRIKRGIKITVRAGYGGWSSGIWRDNFARLHKAIEEVNFYQDMFPDLPLLADFESTNFTNSFAGQIFAIPQIEVAIICDRQLDYDLNDKMYTWTLFDEPDPYALQSEVSSGTSL